jgi:hypothetical protein
VCGRCMHGGLHAETNTNRLIAMATSTPDSPSSSFPSDGASSSSPTPSEQPQQAPRRRIVEYYAETNFKGADLSRHVHIGWGVCVGM